jgi:hypothetical protein
MITYVAQIAPQRSTQYAALADALAPHELMLSPLGRLINACEPLTLGGQAYLKFDLPAALSADQLHELGRLAMTSAFFEYRAEWGTDGGPWLRPLDIPTAFAFPPDLVMTRRYKGKTNETFTQFLCNVARYSSAFAAEPWDALRLFDPLAGGGTTLFAGLVLGANAVAGVEQDKVDVETTAAFIEQYAREQRIPCKTKEERLKKLGRRWWFTLGKDNPRQVVLACGDTVQSAELMNSVKKSHLIVTDLPYGIQHHGELTGLLTQALPVWASLLLPGGALVMAWESTRFPREDMMALAQEAAPALQMLNDPPYNQLAHRVDRVIKNRDVLVLRKEAIPE